MSKCETIDFKRPIINAENNFITTKIKHDLSTLAIEAVYNYIRH